MMMGKTSFVLNVLLAAIGNQSTTYVSAKPNSTRMEPTLFALLATTPARAALMELHAQNVPRPTIAQ